MHSVTDRLQAIARIAAALQAVADLPRGPNGDEHIPAIFRPFWMGLPRPWRPRRLRDVLAELVDVYDAEGGDKSKLHLLIAMEDEAWSRRRSSDGAARRKPGAGRPPRLTQYDEWYRRRKGLYHRLVRLPAAGAKGRAALGRALATCVQSIAAELIASGLRATAQNIMGRLPRMFDGVDESTVRRARKRPLK